MSRPFASSEPRTQSCSAKRKDALFTKTSKEMLQSKAFTGFFTLLRRTKPKSKWNTNTGDGREESIAQDLIQVQCNRLNLNLYIHQEQAALEAIPTDPKPDLISALSLTNTLRTRKKRKSPGPSGLTYDVLKQLDPKIMPQIATAVSEATSTGILPQDWFNPYVKPLCKKPGQPQIRPIALLETWTELIDIQFNQELQRLCEEKTLVCPQQFGFRHSHSATDQLEKDV